MVDRVVLQCLDQVAEVVRLRDEHPIVADEPLAPLRRPREHLGMWAKTFAAVNESRAAVLADALTSTTSGPKNARQRRDTPLAREAPVSVGSIAAHTTAVAPGSSRAASRRSSRCPRRGRRLRARACRKPPGRDRRSCPADACRARRVRVAGREQDRRLDRETELGEVAGRADERLGRKPWLLVHRRPRAAACCSRAAGSRGRGRVGGPQSGNSDRRRLARESRARG